MENKMKKDGWKISRLNINHCEYGEHKGKHTGSVEFKNNNRDSFIFQMTPEKVEQYMDLIRRDVVETAENLGKLLANSIN